MYTIYICILGIILLLDTVFYTYYSSKYWQELKALWGIYAVE